MCLCCAETLSARDLHSVGKSRKLQRKTKQNGKKKQRKSTSGHVRFQPNGKTEALKLACATELGESLVVSAARSSRTAPVLKQWSVLVRRVHELDRGCDSI